MDTQFYFDRSINVPNAGIRSVALGYPDAQLMRNDICLCKANSYEHIDLNGLMLRNALLASKDFIRNYLGLEITDVVASVPHEEVKKAEPPKPKKKEKTKPVVDKSVEDDLEKAAELLSEAKEKLPDKGVKTMEVEDLW